MIPSNELPDTKPWWQSRSVIGSIVSSLAVVAGMAGVSVDVNVVTELAIGLIALVANGVAWYGRVKATQSISTKQVLPGLRLPD